MLHRAWSLMRATVEGYIEDEAMSRGAAIAYYTIFALAPLLVIAIAIAGFVFGREAAEGAVAEQLQGLLGAMGAEAVQALVRSASRPGAGTVATVVSVVTLLVIASGAFSELQSALNAIWRAESPKTDTITAFLFTIGKSLIGWYIGSSAVTGAYGAAGALMVVLLWVYYSAQIFLLGAEFTRAWAGLRAVTPLPPPDVPSPRRRKREEARARMGSPFRMLGSAAIGAALLAVFRRRG